MENIMSERKVLLKTLVGSRAHGLHTEDSDYDWRGVFVEPTSKILSLGYKYKPTAWIEGDVDDTSYEIGHFLHLCTKANPSVLEVLVGETREVDTPLAKEMRDLMPYMYSPQDAFNAFAGYSKNQQKKLLENHMGRANKFAVAYTRTAYNLYWLFKEGEFSLEVPQGAIRADLLDMRDGSWTSGDVLNYAEEYIRKAKELLSNVPNKQDLDKVNNFLLKVRKENW